MFCNVGALAQRQGMEFLKQTQPFWGLLWHAAQQALFPNNYLRRPDVWISTATALFLFFSRDPTKRMELKFLPNRRPWNSCFIGLSSFNVGSSCFYGLGFGGLSFVYVFLEGFLCERSTTAATPTA